MANSRAAICDRAWRDVRNEDKAVAGISLHQVVDLLGDCGGGAYKSLAGADRYH